MKEIRTFEVGTGRYLVPETAQFLSAMIAPNGIAYGYWLCDHEPACSYRAFELVNVATSSSVPDGYTYLCSVPSGRWSTDNYLLFVK